MDGYPLGIQLFSRLAVVHNLFLECRSTGPFECRSLGGLTTTDAELLLRKHEMEQQMFLVHRAKPQCPFMNIHKDLTEEQIYATAGNRHMVDPPPIIISYWFAAKPQLVHGVYWCIITGHPTGRDGFWKWSVMGISISKSTSLSVRGRIFMSIWFGGLGQ